MPKKFIERRLCQSGLHQWDGPDDYRIEVLLCQDTGAIYTVRRCRKCRNIYQRKYQADKRKREREQEKRL